MPVGERLMGTAGETRTGPVIVNSAAVHVIEAAVLEADVSVAAVTIGAGGSVEGRPSREEEEMGRCRNRADIDWKKWEVTGGGGGVCREAAVRS